MTDQIPLDALYDLRLPTQLAVSPDGERVAFVADEFDAEDDERRGGLYVVPTDGRKDPHRLSRASSASSPRWSPDGTKLGFLASREADLATKRARREPGGGDDEAQDEGGDTGGDEPRTQLWLLDLERGGDARQLTDFDEGVREFDWGPDGDRLVVAARDPTEEQAEYLERRREEDGPIEVTRLQHKRDGPGWLDDVTTYLFVADVPATGETVDADSARRLEDAYGAGGMTPLSGVEPRWGSGDRIAFVSCLDENPDDQPYTDLFTIDPDGDDRRQVTDGSLRVAAPRWSPGGSRLAFVGGNPTNWYQPSEVYIADDPAPPAGESSYRSVSASLDRTLAWPGTPEWVDDGTLVTAIADEGWARLVRLDAEADDPERVWSGQGRFRTVELFDSAGGTAAVGLAAPDHPLEVFTLDAADLPADDADPSVRVSDLSADHVAEHPSPEARRVTYENEDGDTVEAIVYLPAEFEPGTDDPAPTIADIHGGPMSYDSPTFEFPVAYWCARGHVVVKPNYRGSTSYGRDWAERLKGTRGDLESDDVVSAVRHLVEAGWADPDRLFCTGFSYGGITTAHVVTRYHDFAAAAPEHGIYDFYSNFGTDDNHTWHEWEFGLPWEHPETYRDLSSLTDVDEIETPLLITAGEEDWRCPPTQAEQLYVSLRKRGVDAKLIIYPGEHHDVGAPRRATHRLDELTTWFEANDPAGEAPESG